MAATMGRLWILGCEKLRGRALRGKEKDFE